MREFPKKGSAGEAVSRGLPKCALHLFRHVSKAAGTTMRFLFDKQVGLVVIRLVEMAGVGDGVIEEEFALNLQSSVFSCLPKAQWSQISSHQRFYSPLLGPTGTGPIIRNSENKKL